MSKNKEEENPYEKMTQIDHIINRPDTYVGSNRLRVEDEFVASKQNDEYKIIKKPVNSSPAFLRIFIEVLSNAVDESYRSKDTETPCTSIKITIDKETGKTSVWNDGCVIPIKIHPKYKTYNHSLIFGELLTSSNYQDKKGRKVSGRNGMGVKLTNIFSTEFSVEGVDPATGKLFKQKWTNNMKNTTGAKVKDTKKAKGYTKVEWTPDFKLFEMDGYTDDIIDLYKKFIIDSSMLTSVKIVLNGERLAYNTLDKYSKLYKTPTDDKLVIKHKDHQILLTTSSEYHTVSFVNGVHTNLGGTHVDAWSGAIFKELLKKVNKKDRPQLTVKDIRQFFRLFVISTLEDPEFSGQSKNKLEFPQVNVSVAAKQILPITKWSVMDKIEELIYRKEMYSLKKVEKNKKGFVKVELHEPANNSGGKLGYQCSLILCEGKSAKAYVVNGIDEGIGDKQGRDWFGIYPLRGKVLNVRKSSIKKISTNAVVKEIIMCCGAKQGVDYTIDANHKELPYGKLYIVTDADADGIHIESLILNIFHVLFPTLLMRKDPYIVSIKTPIVRVFEPGSKKGGRMFYDEIKYMEYVEKNKGKKYKSKYYKGLGTIKNTEVCDTFGKKLINFIDDEKSTDMLNMAFAKKEENARKEWVATYKTKSNDYSIDDGGAVMDMTISNFIEHEAVKYSYANCARSLPHCIDGLKESNRKILYSVKKKKLYPNSDSLKIAQLSGYVAEQSNYHHAEEGLHDTITRMANSYIGSNNIPLLARDGQFGTRTEGGKDAASGRYIYTKMDYLTPYIFREEDDHILTYINDDGQTIEPYFYVPIIPMVLVNGCTTAIATGSSCNVPSYNPKDLIKSIKLWINNKELPRLVPWYRDFIGEVEEDPKDPSRFFTHGVLDRVDKNTVIVKELPVGKSTSAFRNYCEDLLVNKNIKSLKSHSTNTTISFTIKESNDGFLCNRDNLKLSTSVKVTNMTLFDRKGVIIKYKTVNDIIKEFCEVRLDYYVKRIKAQIELLESEKPQYENKIRFIEDVMGKKLVYMNVPEESLIADMEKMKYDKVNDKYDYLLRLQIRSFSKEKVESIKKSLKETNDKLEELYKISPKNLWLRDLNELETEYTKYLKILKNEDKKTKKPKGKQKGTKTLTRKIKK